MRIRSTASTPKKRTSSETKHIVCVCTYKRPELLKRLLKIVALQETDQLFSYSIVVADNGSQSARDVVAEFARSSEIPVPYCIQTQRNIALTRNKAIENAAGDFIAFIDDDEFPAFRRLLKPCATGEKR